MLGICLRYCKNRQEAEELVQEAFYRVFKYIGQIKNIDSPEGWIKKVVINTTIQRYVPKGTLYPVLNFEDADLDVPDTLNIISNVEAKDLIKIIQTLPSSYRLVFNLYVFEGYKHREIAKLLCIAEGTSKSNLFAARELLKKALTGHEVLEAF